MNCISSLSSLVFLYGIWFVHSSFGQEIPPPTSCDPLSLCYAIDESRSIDANQFILQTSALIDITQQFAEISNNSSFSAIGFTSLTKLISPLTSNVQEFIAALESNSQDEGSTNSGAALTRCAEVLEASDQERPRLIVLITDGEDGGQGLIVAPVIKSQGFTIATIGVGPKAPETSLPKIASDPSLYTDVANFGMFAESTSTIIEDFCSAPTFGPTPTSSPTSEPTTVPCETLNACFAIDETGSISPEQFQIQTDAITNITTLMSARAPSSQFSAVGFANVAKTISQPTNNFLTFISNLQSNLQENGSTSTGSGLQRCADLIRSSSSPSTVPRLLVLLTDGVDNVRPFGEDVAPSLKTSNFIIATLGIGPFASQAILTGIASIPSLYTNVRTFAEFSTVIPNVVDSFCQLPNPAPPSPSPTPSGSPRPFAPNDPISLDQLPEFDVNGTETENLEVLRQYVEYFVRAEIGFDAKIRVEAYVVSAVSPIFPWNIIQDENGNRFYWPGQTPSPSPIIPPSAGRMVVESSSKQSGVPNCPASQCAAHVVVYSEKFIRWILVRKAINKFFATVKTKKGFGVIFNRSEFRIVRQAPKKFSVVLKFGTVLEA